jgi:hypothetical protein
MEEYIVMVLAPLADMKMERVTGAPLLMLEPNGKRSICAFTTIQKAREFVKALKYDNLDLTPCKEPIHQIRSKGRIWFGTENVVIDLDLDTRDEMAAFLFMQEG